MKNIVKATITLSVIAFASITFANPKCSHRMASGSNDLFKNTNPVKMKVAKATLPTGSKNKSGVR